MISGFELELTGLVTENFQVFHSLAYTDAILKEFDTTVVTGFDTGSNTVISEPMDRSDEDMPRVPRWQAFLGLTYSINTDEYGSISPSIEWTYRTAMNHSFDRGSYESGLWMSKEEVFTNARIVCSMPDERTTVTAWVKNLEGIDDYLVGGVPLVDFAGSGGQVYAEPRMYGMDFSYRFGD